MFPQVSPIGIYDSGVGGLTVWSALGRMVDADLLYYGDTAHLPYGDKTPEEILWYSRAIITFLQARGAKVIVAACNTSSALALPTLAPELSIPVFGVIEPAVMQAKSVTKCGRVGLLATVGTVNSGAYQKAFTQLAPDIELVPVGCPRLVPLVEQGTLSGPMVVSALRECLDPLLQRRVDTLVLGCTHYPFLLPQIRCLAGNLQIVDPAYLTAKTVVTTMGWTQGVPMGRAKRYFWVSGDPEEFSGKAELFLGRNVHVIRQDIPVLYDLDKRADGGAFIGRHLR